MVPLVAHRSQFPQPDSPSCKGLENIIEPLSFHTACQWGLSQGQSLEFACNVLNKSRFSSNEYTLPPGPTAALALRLKNPMCTYVDKRITRAQQRSDPPCYARFVRSSPH